MISLGSRYSLGMFTLEVKTDRQSLDETEKLRTVSLPAPAINKLMVGMTFIILLSDNWPNFNSQRIKRNSVYN